ncbi:MAG: MAPEG family protein, partial [Gammaproteobacteria bacterium]
MNTVIACLLVLTVMPITCAWVSGYYRSKLPGGFDNKHPRVQATQLTGAGARAIAAQANSWEALAIYSAALLAVVLSGMDVASIATLSLAVVAFRVAYVASYLAN